MFKSFYLAKKGMQKVSSCMDSVQGYPGLLIKAEFAKAVVFGFIFRTFNFMFTEFQELQVWYCG